jgi:hypothetical protein
MGIAVPRITRSFSDSQLSTGGRSAYVGRSTEPCGSERGRLLSEFPSPFAAPLRAQHGTVGIGRSMAEVGRLDSAFSGSGRDHRRRWGLRPARRGDRRLMAASVVRAKTPVAEHPRDHWVDGSSWHAKADIGRSIGLLQEDVGRPLQGPILQAIAGRKAPTWPG